jgi:uncharacterized protein
MRSLLPLFGRSPFKPLQAHMEKVQESLVLIRPFFEAFLAGDDEKAREIRKKILKLEHEADVLKNDIRDHLPHSYFMPVDRRDLLSMLHQQDDLADLCEDLVIVATLRESLPLPADFHPKILETVDLSIRACNTARELLDRLDELQEASFGGPEAEAVLAMVHRVGLEEHEVDKHIYTLAREMFRRESEFEVTALWLWQKILELIGKLANASESIGDHLRLMLSR